MVCLGLSFGINNAKTAKAQEPTVALLSVDTEYNNTVWGGNTMAVGIKFDKNFTAKAYDANDGGFDAPIIADVRNYVKINGQAGSIQLSFLVEENANRIVFLYDSSWLTVPDGQEYTTFTIEAGAPFGGQYLPAVTLYLIDGQWSASMPTPEPDPITESVTVTNIHNRAGSDQRLLLFISNSNYDTANADVSAKIASLNVLDYVNVYTSKTEYKTLREIYQGNAQAKIWGETNAIGFQVDANYHGTAVYAVEIKAGAQFPSSANNYDMYVVSADVTYYNNSYQADASANGWAVSWTTVKPVEPETPTLGTPDVEFVELHADNNNSVWGGSTRAVRLVFSDNFDAKAYDGNDGGFDAPVIANVRAFVTINGQSLGNFTFLQIDNENSITFLYDESLLAVPDGQDYTVFTIEAGAPFGGHYLPAVTLYFVNGSWQATEPIPEPDPVTESVTVVGIHNRKGSDQRLVVIIDNSDYIAHDVDITAEVQASNLLDYVNVYTSETEYVTLREIFQNSATSAIWETTNSIAFAVDANYHGTAVYAVEIKAGAQFPAKTNSYTTYVTAEDIVYYNVNYNSSDTGINDFSVTWTTQKPETPDEPHVPTLGTPDVEFVELHADNNNSVWGGSTRAVRLVFSESFTAKAYDGNDGGFDAPVIADVRAFVTINGQSLGNVTFLQIDNENSITFLYDESLLAVPDGQDYTVFTIEAGAPFGGHYLPAVTLYFANGSWQTTEPVPDPDPVTESVTVSNIHNRKGDDQRLLLFLSQSDYSASNANVTDLIANLNVLDYVYVYTSETEYVTLREIYQGNAQAKIWGEANSIGFAVDSNYHGAAVYAVEIKAGAQFPAVSNGYTTYVTAEDIVYYNVNYNSSDTGINDFSVTWTTQKPETPDEPHVPTLGTPDVEFVELHADNNNSVWGGATRALRLVFSDSFDAKAYDANEGGFDAPVIADVRAFVTINGQPLGDVTFLQIDNENSITFLYNEDLLTVPSGYTQTVFTIEAGAPFGGHYLPEVTLYFNGESWQTEEVDVEVKFTGVVPEQNNTSWNDAQNSVRIRFNYRFNDQGGYNINDADGLNLISKLTFSGVSLTENDILVFAEDVGGNTITIVYNKDMLNWAFEEGSRYHTLSLTEGVSYLGVDIPAFTLYLRNGAWVTECPQMIELGDVETAVGYNTRSLIHIRDWNLDGDEETAVNNMILFFLPSGGFPEGQNLFLDVDKVAEYNVFDKIKLHMIDPNADADGDGFVTLGQVFNAGGWYPSELSGNNDRIVVVNIWETENCIAFSMGAQYTAESFDYIIIEEGCEFPNYYYTNGSSAIDYVQNGEIVDYANLERVSFIQTCDVKIYTNPDDFQGPSLNTNWAIDTNMGEITVSGVDYKDGYVIIELEGSNYPMGEDENGLNQNVAAGNTPLSLNMLEDIYVNGISLYDRVVHFGANGITSYYNYDGYGNFAISVVLANANEVVTEIIVAKDLRVPIYGLSDIASAAYGVMYTETVETVSYTKGTQGFTKDEVIYWTITFNDGESVKVIKVADGETLSSDEIPATPTKAGYEFAGWVYGIDGIYSFEPTAPIKSCYYLTVRWTERSESTPTPPTSSEESSSSSSGGGCMGAVGSFDMAVCAVLIASGMLFIKKKRA